MKALITVLILLAALGVSSAGFFTVNETEQVVVTRFGRTVGETLKTPGLYFKVPLVDKAIFFEKRTLEWDGDANQIPTKDKKYIMVDTTARWRITDPLTFLQTVGNENGAQTRLDDIIDSSVRNEISSHNLIEIVRNSNRVIGVLREELKESQTEEESSVDAIAIGREKITRNILQKAKPTIEKYGIELIDVRIKGLNYEASVEEKVYGRMISERNKIAEKLRSEGLAEKAKIQGKLNLELKTIESEAYKKAQEIKGEADAAATKIYASAFGADPELYNFLTSLEAYDTAIGANGTLVLSTNSEFFKVLKNGR
jgi:membrane protease subunit HflC